MQLNKEMIFKIKSNLFKLVVYKYAEFQIESRKLSIKSVIDLDKLNNDLEQQIAHNNNNITITVIRANDRLQFNIEIQTQIDDNVYDRVLQSRLSNIL